MNDEPQQRIAITEEHLRPAAETAPPSLREAATDLLLGHTEEDQYARHGALRSIGGTSYAMAGVMIAAENPGLVPKVFGAALVAKGVHESITAGRMLRGEAKEETRFMRMRDRVSEFGQSLVDRTTGKMNLRAKLKRYAGEELAVVNDKEYANRFSRMTGGIAMTLAGVEFMNQPGTAPKIIAGGLMSLGVFEMMHNIEKLNKRTAEVNDPRG